MILNNDDNVAISQCYCHIIRGILYHCCGTLGVLGNYHSTTISLLRAFSINISYPYNRQTKYFKSFQFVELDVLKRLMWHSHFWLSSLQQQMSSEYSNMVLLCEYLISNGQMKFTTDQCEARHGLVEIKRI